MQKKDKTSFIGLGLTTSLRGKSKTVDCRLSCRQAIFFRKDRQKNIDLERQICYNGPMKEYLYEIAKACGKEITAEQLGFFDDYYETLVEWNKKTNLTALTEARDVALKHFLDSLTAEWLIPTGARVADVGSGAGFPGLPLKIYRPDIEITLMDSLNKRIAFLNEIIAKLKLNGATAVHIRAEDAGRGVFRGSFDIVVARAVAKLNVLCEYALPLLKKGGSFIAYKTQDSAEVKEAQAGIKVLGGEVEKVCNFKLQELGRSLIVVKKINFTPEQYPREAGKIKKKPL